uniref:Uncharacterized protein n=1 Tax=Amphimedon queenslandica TaxID=400682 RepID=A0A1X7UNJ1_AMPQE
MTFFLFLQPTGGGPHTNIAISVSFISLDTTASCKTWKPQSARETDLSDEDLHVDSPIGTKDSSFCDKGSKESKQLALGGPCSSKTSYQDLAYKPHPDKHARSGGGGIIYQTCIMATGQLVNDATMQAVVAAIQPVSFTHPQYSQEQPLLEEGDLYGHGRPLVPVDIKAVKELRSLNHTWKKLLCTWVCRNLPSIAD